MAEVGQEVCVSTVLAGPFTTAAALRGADVFVRDLYNNKEWVHKLIELCCQAGLKFIDEDPEKKVSSNHCRANRFGKSGKSAGIR